MISLRMIFAGCALAALTACGSVDTATRNTPAPTGLDALQAESVQPKNYNVVDYSVRVPSNLTISEANSYYPVADIVWRGDALGDRHMQVAKIFQDSLERAIPNVEGEIPVKVIIDLRRFHSLTERARYTVGGVHNMEFYVSVVNVKTGQVLENRRLVESNLPALGGAAAVAADARGMTQKVRVMDHLTNALARELGARPASDRVDVIELTRG